MTATEAEGLDFEAVRRRAVGALAAEEAQLLGEISTQDILDGLPLPFVDKAVVGSLDEARLAAGKLGARNDSVVLKAVSDQVVHKSDHGLVLLDVIGEAGVSDAYQSLRERCEEAGIAEARVVVQPMMPPGVDLFLGLQRDETFGPVIIVGIGGTRVELERDVAYRCTPVSAHDATELLRSLRGFPLIDGWRGGHRYPLEQFSALTSVLSALADDVPEIGELEFNPVRLLPSGEVVILDARLRLVPVTGREIDLPSPPAKRSLEALFNAASVAVVGASRDPARPGGRLLANLIGHDYAGRIYPVNPTAEEVRGYPAYPSLAALPEVPDLVCVAVPAAATVPVVAEASSRGVPAIVALASGFGEIGGAGEELERALRDAVGPSTALCGPNTIGVVSVPTGLAATFTQAIEGNRLREGGIAFISQSGAIGGSLLSKELVAGYGFRYWVTVGNEIDVSVSDYLDYFIDDPGVSCVAIFLEGLKDGARFRSALARAQSRDLPVVVFKTGTSAEGARAVELHSAALSGSAEVYASVLAAHGAITVSEVTALFEVAYVASAPNPLHAGVGLISTSGGAASVGADLLSAAGIPLPHLAPQTLEALSSFLPTLARPHNPLDVTAEGAFAAGVLGSSVAAMAQDPSVGAICVVLTSLVGDDAERIGAELAEAAEHLKVPVLVTWMVDPSLAVAGRARLAERQIRVFDEPARMVRALASAMRRASSSSRLTAATYSALA